ncbi:YajQ family cyclic di-GMP-binding protein [Desulfovibrio inopinatus]|uniref:YajQ family cyclic di-GMP-binding protein n=1 Tax=Desulfovibrio inopinatus TaxID=102109 RepID=UPI000405B2A5|nr:YajQ family cyclic di-GMP-binding protein [Desulfovibrio inopinatus]
MPSFDVVSRVDLQEIDNAVNNSLKEIASRFDFRGSKTELTFDKKNVVLHVSTESDMRLKAVRDMLIGHCVKRKVDVRALDFGDPKPGAGQSVKQDIKVKEGIDKDTAKKIVKLIKDSKLKVQSSIQDDQVRVTGKKIDDLQSVITLLKGQELDVALQFVNMKS